MVNCRSYFHAGNSGVIYSDKCKVNIFGEDGNKSCSKFISFNFSLLHTPGHLPREVHVELSVMVVCNQNVKKRFGPHFTIWTSEKPQFDNPTNSLKQTDAFTVNSSIQSSLMSFNSMWHNRAHLTQTTYDNQLKWHGLSFINVSMLWLKCCD